MKFKYLYLLILLLASASVNAQLLKGTVYDGGGSTRLPNVFIQNLTTKQAFLADKNGNFQIKAASGHLLVFSSPTYTSDTVFVTDMSPKKIRMVSLPIALRDVNINATRQKFDPHTEYPDIYTKSKVYVLSPSSWFSREGRNARRLKRFFAKEEKERAIDDAFSKAYVSSLIPLRGEELDSFMSLYRPTYEFVTGNSKQTMVVYISDSYKKFMALPPEKRKLEQLKDTVGQ
ncbi:hypothetical protein GCM10023149_35910 [Mucilaginibacter gynuensis]|uniref:Carboxypeptidase-like protein n=1 Tax=Mucilaginibacter gynuensis TaxID=1302236 RepID=A0ABP8GVL1_9SPHI